jgi:hypothetical protein
MEPKYVKTAKVCLHRIKGGKTARLDAESRLGMIRELGAHGIRLEGRTSAAVASRYDVEFGHPGEFDSARADAWSDAARAAALEARKASAKANKTGAPGDHQAAQKAHEKASAEVLKSANNNALTGRNPAASMAAGDKASDKHLAAAAQHLSAGSAAQDPAFQSKSGAMHAVMAQPGFAGKINALAGRDKLVREAQEHSAAANKATAAMKGGGSPEDHDKAAALHAQAKQSWLKAESTARSIPGPTNVRVSENAHSYAEQHAVTGGDHAYAAGALRSARSRSRSR